MRCAWPGKSKPVPGMLRGPPADPVNGGRSARDGACVHPLRQRARAHGQRPARLVPVLRHRQQLHRARRAMGEPIRRVVQRPVARRVPGRRAVRQPARGAGAARGLADRVQPRSARTAAWAGSPRLPTPSAGRLSYTLDSHKRWSREGGPVTFDLPPKNRTEHRVRESVQVREKGERNEQAEAVRS